VGQQRFPFFEILDPRKHSQIVATSGVVERASGNGDLSDGETRDQT
jgi:hypothetical protein